MNKKSKIIGGAAAASAVAAAVALSGVGSTETYEIDYSLNPVNEYVTELSLDASEEMGADIVILKVNGDEIDTALLPDAKLRSVPLVFEGLDNLSIDLYCRGERIGTAEFDGDKLTAEVRK